MSVEAALSIVVGIVATGVAAYMGYRFVRKRKAHHALWAAGLGLWATSAFTQASALLGAWSVPSYRAYYFSAIALAGLLGAGTLGLILQRRGLFRGFSAYILAATAVFGIAVALAPVDEAVLTSAVIGGAGFPASVRLITPFINVPGGIGFIGGALYTVVKLRRPFAVFITLGATLPALGGVLARFSMPWFLPFTDFLGISFLAAGIYLSVHPMPTVRPAETHSAPP